MKTDNWIVMWCVCDRPVPIRFHAKLTGMWFEAKCKDCGHKNRFKYFNRIPQSQELPVVISTDNKLHGVIINEGNYKRYQEK